VSGVLHRFSLPPAAGVRVDAGVADGSAVGVHYDAMLAKVIAHGASRAEAVRRVARALAAAQIHGLQTNRELLLGILAQPAFLAGEVDTHFLMRHQPASLVAAAVGGRDVGACALAAALAAQQQRRREATVLAALPSGFRNNPAHYQAVSFEVDGRGVAVEYRWRRGELQARVDGEERAGVCARRVSPQSVELELDGVLRRFDVHRVGDRHYVDAVGWSCALRELPRFPLAADLEVAGSLTAPMPAVVRRVLVAAGERVEKGQTLLVLEAMKMEQPVLAPATGVLRQVAVAEGDQVEAGEILALIDADE
jgi:acetyl/propionyl-CoA carboxylase alpha subunit